jgi:hypothetical protein
MPATWPLTLEDYKAWARIAGGDTADDVAIQQAIDAVSEKFTQLLRPMVWSSDPSGQVASDVAEAGLLYVNRLLSRRNSPDGVVGVSDLGTATILPRDADIQRLLGPYLATVLA